ncbi:16934_t:CDS:2, partial [Funneliformis caledonium]
SCVKSITNAVSSLSGIVNISVSLENNEAIISYNESKITKSKIIETIENCGFVNAFKDTPGIINIDVSLEDERAIFDFNENLIQEDEIIEGIEYCGFDVPREYNNIDIEQIKNVVLPVKGMTCNSCVMSITNALNQIQGINNVIVNLNEENATVDYDERL